MRSFRLMLEDDIFNKWKLYYPNHGTRQTLMRRVVRLMIQVAEDNTPNIEAFFNAEIRMILGKHEGREQL